MFARVLLFLATPLGLSSRVADGGDDEYDNADSHARETADCPLHPNGEIAERDTQRDYGHNEAHRKYLDRLANPAVFFPVAE